MQDKSTQKPNKVYRSKSNKIIGGVCGGIAEYFNIDALIVRLFWVFFTLVGGAGIIAYIAALIIMPENPDQEEIKKVKTNGVDGAKLWGSILIIFGIILLIRQTGFFYHFYFWDIPWKVLIGSLLVGLGAYIIFRKGKSKTSSEETNYEQADDIDAKQFYRIQNNKMIAGVCTGLAHYFDIDVTLIRLLWVFATLATSGIGIIVYIIAIIIFPELPEHKQINTGNE